MKTERPVYPFRNHRGPGARLLQQLCVAILICLPGAGLAAVTTVNLYSGTGGIFMPSQSYNETRAADVTVLSPVDLAVSFMTLSGIQGAGLARAVIYDSGTQALVASAQGNLIGGTITLPILATLVSGHEYRIGFSGILSDGTGFLPNSFPYTESSGLLRINSAWDGEPDTFPNFPNLEVPEVSLQVSPVPEPGTVALAGVALLVPMLIRKQSRHKI